MQLLCLMFEMLAAVIAIYPSVASHLARLLFLLPHCTQPVKLKQMEQWHHRRMPDPRLVMDGDDFLPCQVAVRRQHTALARMLLPSTPLVSLLGEGEVTVLGPPSLAQIAGGVLRQAMEAELQGIQQATGVAQPDDAAAAAGGEASVPTGGDSITAADAAAVAAAAAAQDDGEAAARAADAAAAHGVPACKTPDMPQHGGAAAVAEQAAGSAGTVLSLERSASSSSGRSCGGCSSAASSCSSDDMCGVCFEAAPLVALQPCKHQLCLGCCLHLLQMNSRCVLVCPFCRWVVHLWRHGT
jgi:hypothetical protein